MLPPSRKMMLIFFAIIGSIFVLFNIHSVWSQSVDLAHHYALVARITEHHDFAGGSDSSLGEMNYYPRASHLLASIAALLLKSDFLGIQFVSLASIALLWGSIFYLISFLPSRLAAVTAVLLGVALVINQRIIPSVQVHGFEVVGNFFYSQLVAQAGVLLVMAMSVSLRASNRVVLGYALMAASVVILTSVHLLPALELFAMLLGLLVLDVLTNVVLRRAYLRELMFLAVMAVLVIVGVYLNPAFKAMRQISENNGGLDLSYLTYPIGLSGLCIFALCLSLVLLWCSYRLEKSSLVGATATRYFSIYGAGIAVLCLVQILLVRFGMGSDYAAKKYAFGLFSFVGVSMAGLIGWALCQFLQYRPVRPVFGRLATLSVVSIGYALVLFGIAPMYSDRIADKILGEERELKMLASTLLPPAGDGRSNVSIALPGMSQVLNYMFSIAVFDTARNLAIPDVLVNNSISDFRHYASIITSLGSAYDKKECRLATTGSLVILNAQCLSGTVEKATACQGLIDFSSGGLLDTSRLEGLGSAEQYGRWTVARHASISCDSASGAVSEAVLNLQPFVAGKMKGQRLQISVESNLLFDKEITADDTAPILIKLPPLHLGKPYKIELSMPDAISPLEVGLSSDDRTLGFYIRNVVFK